MENEDLELLEDENPEVEESKTIDRYFDQCFKDNPINVKFSEFNLDQSMQGENVPTITLVNKFILKALQENVKEIRIIPLQSGILVRFNQGSGFYKPFETNFPVNLIHPLANIIRLNAGMGMLARGKPVLGKMRLIYQDKPRDIVIYTFPSIHGESLSLCFKDV